MRCSSSVYTGVFMTTTVYFIVSPLTVLFFPGRYEKDFYSAFGLRVGCVRNHPNLRPNLPVLFGLPDAFNWSVTRTFHAAVPQSHILVRRTSLFHRKDRTSSSQINSCRIRSVCEPKHAEICHFLAALVNTLNSDLGVHLKNTLF